jgi:hypothetical protein
MITTFAQKAIKADGRFLNDEELQGLEAYAQTFAPRNQAYTLLSQRSDELVLQSLRQLARIHRNELKVYGATCKRDMAYALKCIAQAVLTDELEEFQQDFALWMENIMRAVHKGELAAHAYRSLKIEVQKALPPQSAALVTPYINNLITAFSDS